MDGRYSFEQMDKELDSGYILFFDYVRNRYQVFKTAENCYTQILLTDHPKNPLPKNSIITKKRFMEMYPFVEKIEYKALESK